MFSALGMTDRPAFSKATKTIIMPKKKVNNPKLCSGKAPKPVSTPSRTVKSETIEKWKTELADFNVNEWLFYKTDAKGAPVSIHCKFCIQYEENIKHVDGFTNQFIVGSTNFRKSNVQYHAENTKAHTKAYEFYLKDQGKTSKESNEELKKFKHSGAGSSSVISGLAKMEKNEVERMRLKFETALFIAKEELPLTKFEKVLDLEKHHGVKVGEAYKNNKQAGVFIDCIGETIKSGLAKRLSHAKFLSVLCDGSTDSSVKEQEAIYVTHFDPEPAGN